MANWVVRSVAVMMPESRWFCWVEVFDCGGLGEAEALGFIVGFAGRGLGIGREWGDAGCSREEGGAEVRYGVADGGDAAQAGDDDTIQCCSPLGSRLMPGTPLPPIGVFWRKIFIFSNLDRVGVCKIFIIND